MRELRKVVYMIKSRGPRTEPWGHHNRKYVKKKVLFLHLTWKERDDVVFKPIKNRAMNTKPRRDADD